MIVSLTMPDGSSINWQALQIADIAMTVEGSPRTGAAAMLRRSMDLTVTFTLQVLGGCGAVWGCAEWLSIRGGPNNDNWRVISLIVGFVCFARWFMIQAWGDHRINNVFASFLLQVCGAAGAIWGVAEILGLRVNYPLNCHEPQQGNTGTFFNHVLTGEFTGPGRSWAPGYGTCQNTYLLWRVLCGVVFLLFLCRWNRLVPRNAVVKFLDLHVATFVLDVLGGAGAIWGCSEVFGPGGHSLRLGWGDVNFGQPTFDFWRIACSPIFCLCLFAWALTWAERESEHAKSMGATKAPAGLINKEILPTLLTSRQVSCDAALPKKAAAPNDAKQSDEV